MTLTKKQLQDLGKAFKEGSNRGSYADSDEPEVQKDVACFFLDMLHSANLINFDDGSGAEEIFSKAAGVDLDID